VGSCSVFWQLQRNKNACISFGRCSQRIWVTCTTADAPTQGPSSCDVHASCS
jgi:hypothetical protein